MKHILGLFTMLLFAQFLNGQTKDYQTIPFDSLKGSPPASLEQVAWIAGNWEGQAFGGQVEEVWSEPTSGSMMGMFKLFVDGKPRFYELMVISEENNSLILRLKHFNADMTSWEEKEETVDFPLVKIEGKKAYFDNFTFDRTSDTRMDVYVVISMEEGKKNEFKVAYRLKN